MRVLVTGHLGYIGTIMVPMLLARGHQVTGVDSDLYGRCGFGAWAPADVGELRKDIRDLELGDFEGFDAVIHLAGLSNDPLGDLDPALTEEINYKATIWLGLLAKKAGVKRFLFSSSCSTYGAAGDDLIDETARFNPVTPYGRSKVYSEIELLKLAGEDFSPTFLRSATAYGVSPRLRFDLVLNNLVAWAFTTGRVLLKSDGSPWRPIVHIEDISRAFIAALEAPREDVHGESFNVGSTEENYRMRELAAIVAEVVPGSRVEIAAGAGPDKRCYRVDCSKIRRVLPRFEPQWTPRAGAESLYRACRDTGLTLEEFEGERYHRLAHLKSLLRAGTLAPDLRRAVVPATAGGSLRSAAASLTASSTS